MGRTWGQNLLVVIGPLYGAVEVGEHEEMKPNNTGHPHTLDLYIIWLQVRPGEG